MDVLARLRGVLPRGWFSDIDAALDVVLTGAAAVWNVLLGQLADTLAQARLLTATGAWLDQRVADYLPPRFRRRTNEIDTEFAARASREILRPRSTRHALELLLADEGAQSVRVFEPIRPYDTGGYGVAMGYGVAGAYGSVTMPYQVLVDAKRPPSAQRPGAGGYGAGYGYGVAGAYGTAVGALGGATDADLYASIVRVLPAGGTAWIRLR